MQKWITGMNYLRLGCQDLLHPSVRHFIILPLCINLLIFSALFYVGFHYSIEKLSFLSEFALPSWLAWLQGVVTVLQFLFKLIIFVVLLVVMGLLATLGANLLACPFNGLLSEVFSKYLGEPPPKTHSMLNMMSMTFYRELKKLGYYLPKAMWVGIGCLVLQFVPLLNLMTPFIFYGFASWIMAIQYLDYPADNFQVPFHELLMIMKKQKSLCLGFGLSVALLCTIPFINFIVMPAAVLGATRLWHGLDISADLRRTIP